MQFAFTLVHFFLLRPGGRFLQPSHCEVTSLAYCFKYGISFVFPVPFPSHCISLHREVILTFVYERRL
jgi:hypothetical protein